MRWAALQNKIYQTRGTQVHKVLLVSVLSGVSDKLDVAHAEMKLNIIFALVGTLLRFVIA